MPDEQTRETLLGAELNGAGGVAKTDDVVKADDVVKTDDVAKADDVVKTDDVGKTDDVVKTDDVGKTDEGGKAKEDGAIVYEFKAPEGMDLDEAMLGKLRETCTKLKVPKDDAQSLLDLGVELVRKNSAAAHDAWNAELDSWEAAIKAHPTLGGENLKASMSVAARPIARFGGEEFRKMVTKTGIGSNPHFFEFMHAIGTAMGDDNPPAGDKSSSGAGADLDREGLMAALFPTTTPRK